MQLYIYAHSSHREGLENVRRASALCNILKEFGPTLCTGDYRAASIAKDTMGTPRTMGIDAVGNLPFVMERLDMLMYDNEAVTQEMHEQMERFCSRVYNVGKDIPLDTVDESYFGTFAHKREKAFFFADDDYKKWFVDFCKDSQKHDFALIKGNYFFLDALESLEPSFCELIDEEDYKDTIQSTKYLLSASLHTCLESLASGNFPVYFQRADQEM